MKITRNNTAFDIKINTEVPLTLINPMFNDTGTYTYPFDTPATPQTLSALGHPSRPDRADRYINKAPATLQHGLFQLTGTHTITSINTDSITHDFIADEGAFYEAIGNRMLDEAMTTVIIPPVSPDDSWRYAWLLGQLRAPLNEKLYGDGILDYDFVCFPICVETEPVDGGINYIVLNKTDSAGIIRYETDSEGNINPNGITPFLYLRTVIRELFAHFSFTILSNPFLEVEELRYAVLLNNTVDTLITPAIHYKHLVPSVTITTFIQAVEAQFGCKFFINYRLRTVNILFLKDIFNARPTKDLSAKMQAPVSVGFSAPQQLTLTVGQSFSKAATIGDSKADIFAKTKPITIPMGPDDEGAIRSTPGYTPAVIYASDRQKFYKAEFIEWIHQNDIYWSRYSLSFFSSIFHNYQPGSNLEEFAVENAAEAVPNIRAKEAIPAISYWFIDIPFYETGVRRFRPNELPDFVPLVNGYDNSECPVAFCFYRGYATANYNGTVPNVIYYDITYAFASSYNNHPCGTLDPQIPHDIQLMPHDIKQRYYNEYERFLRYANELVTAQINLTSIDINNINWWEKVWINGQPYFIDKINITLIGDSDIRVDSVELRTARYYNLQNETPPETPYLNLINETFNLTNDGFNLVIQFDDPEE